VTAVVAQEFGEVANHQCEQNHDAGYVDQQNSFLQRFVVCRIFRGPAQQEQRNQRKPDTDGASSGK